MGAVYFIATNNAVKIGFSDSVPSRLESLQTANPENLTLIGAVRGDIDLEKFFHSKLKDFCTNREWFRKCPEVLAFIDGVLATYPTPDEEVMLPRHKRRFIPPAVGPSKDSSIEIPDYADAFAGANDIQRRVNRINDCIEAVIEVRRVEKQHGLKPWSLARRELRENASAKKYSHAVRGIFPMMQEALSLLRDALDFIEFGTGEESAALAKASALVEGAERKLRKFHSFGAPLVPAEALLTRQSLSVVREQKERE